MLVVDWSDLAFQPYFSQTATNVGFGFWSHDLVGPPDTSASARELHTRWLQWGAFSGVFRTHDRGMSAGTCANDDPNDCFVVEVFNTHKENFKINRAAMIAREELVPYTYTAFRAAFETGLSLIRPMYYYYPEMENAFLASPSGSFVQYMFGPDILVSPAVFESDVMSGLTPVSIWIPPGPWYEVGTGVVHTGASDGSTVLTKAFPLHEIPMFVRGSAIVPKIPVVPGDTLGLALRQYTHLVVELYPPLAPSATTTLYEDDGATLDYYTKDAYALTTLSYTSAASGGSTTLKLTVQSNKAKPYPLFPTSRVIEVKIVAGMPLVSGSVNGVSLSSQDWSYDGDKAILVVKSPQPVPTGSPATIILEFDTPDMTLLSGARGMIDHGIHAKKKLDQTRVTPGAHSGNGGKLMNLATAGFELSTYAKTNPTSFMSTLKSLPSRLSAAVTELESVRPDSLPSYAFTQLYDASRQDNALCAAAECHADNSYYQTLRVEGYGVAPGTPGAIPLLAFYASAYTDNAASTNPLAFGNIDDTYTPAAFSANGWVLSSQASGSVPLQLFYSASRHDYLTVASQAGIDYAHSNGYTLIDGAVGYVYPSQQGQGTSTINSSRWSYAYALLNNSHRKDGIAF